ncbi:MAG: protein arginine kinase [Clostridiales bacterium]|nr:protein arginine kinase [Clostridiales bacterium]MCD7828168.1 protein arginine kinase [Clostridiales bacterium]
MNKWYENTESNNDVVLSTRIRFARNLEDYPFPCRLDAQGREKVCHAVRDAFSDVSGLKLKYIEMQDLTEKQAVALAERHLISPDFAVPAKGRALLLSDDESISIMLCEEDHIRIQVIKSGLDFEGAFKLADDIDNLLDSKLKYAFDERIGYLTQCPTNLGTGMRASVMMHLPALTKCNQISKLASTISKLGLTLRGTYGEGTSAKGDIFQLSNQVSLGISERAALDNLKAITMQIATQERTAGEEFVKNVNVLDRITRAYGILSSAKLLSTDEMLELFSWVRLGAMYNIIDADIAKLNELTETMQAATLSCSKGEDLTSDKRDEIRAEAVKQALKK